MTTKFVIVERKFSGRHVAVRGLSFETREAAAAHIAQCYSRWPTRFVVESRVVKADDTATRKHCQCCGRAILANTGTIAHHGYERPGHGWQTASCYGAKQLPWEVSRDALGKLIQFLRNKREELIVARGKIAREELPVVFHYSVHDRRTGKREERKLTLTRATFDAVKAEDQDRQFSDYRYDRDSFDKFLQRECARRTNELEHITRDINEFQRRYDDWKQTHEWRDGAWFEL